MLTAATLRSLLAGAILVACLPLLGLSALHLERMRIAGLSRSAADAYHVPPPRVLQALTFGYNELAADLLWVRTIAYFTDRWAAGRDFAYLERYLRTITALDPRFKPAYRFGAAMIVSRGDRHTNEEVRAAIRLLERGHELFPDEWRFPLLIGSYYMDLRTEDPEQRAEWRRLGADWIRRAALVGAEIPWLPSLATKVYTEQGQRELAIMHLQEMYLTTKDERMRQQIAGKLKHLEEARLAEELKQAAAEWREAREESALGFLPPDFFVLVHQPALPPFSLEEDAAPPAEDNQSPPEISADKPHDG